MKNLASVALGACLVFFAVAGCGGAPSDGAGEPDPGTGGRGEAPAVGPTAGSGGAATPGASGPPASAPVSVVWTFPGLIPDSARGLTFPTYVAHLFGRRPMHKLATDLVCAELTNPGAAVDVALEVRFPVYAQDATQNVTVPAHATTRVCANPVLDLAKLYAIRDVTPGRIEVTLRQGGAATNSTMKAVAIAPVGDIAWAAPGVMKADLVDLSPVFVTPRAPEVDQLQRLAAEASVFGGFGGGDPYQREPYRRELSLSPSEYVKEWVFIESDESLAWKLLAVDGGGVDVYAFTGPQFTAWAKDESDAATKVWSEQTTGASEGATLSPGWYLFVVYNPHDEERAVEWTRSVTRQDVAADALRSIYVALKALNTKYSNITDSYFQNWQHVRLASEVIAARSANCIDGSLLFSSVLELVGMEPVLIFKTGHAYVGVRAAPNSPRIWPIETTAIGTADFEDAFDFAVDSLAADGKNDPKFRLVPVKTARGRGILPLPQ